MAQPRPAIPWVRVEAEMEEPASPVAPPIEEASSSIERGDIVMDLGAVEMDIVGVPEDEPCFVELASRIPSIHFRAELYC